MPWTGWPDNIAANQLVSSTWLSNVSKSLAFLERVGYTEFVADVTINTTTVGTAVQIVSLGAITYENVPHVFEFWCSRYTAPATSTNFILRDGTTVLGTFPVVTNSNDAAGLVGKRFITPTAASHTYNVAAWLGAAGTGTVRAGSGGAAGDGSTPFPGYLSVFRVPT